MVDKQAVKTEYAFQSPEVEPYQPNNGQAGFVGMTDESYPTFRLDGMATDTQVAAKVGLANKVPKDLVWPEI